MIGCWILTQLESCCRAWGIDPNLLPANPSLKQIAAAATLLGDGEARFYPELREVLEASNLAPGTILRTLAGLAEVSLFPFFFTTTPDQLLERALRLQNKTVEVAAFHPRQPEDIRTTGNIFVYHLFGVARNFPACAISSEDTLDYAISFSRHLSDLRQLQRELVGNSLLILGLELSDWLTRVLLKVGLGPRFDDRTGGRWMAELTSLAELAENPAESFPNSTVLFIHQRGGISAIPAEPIQFVLELERRLSKGQSSEVSRSNLTGERKKAERSIFISCAREDSEAAAQLAAQLQHAGLPVWLDKSELRFSDDWAREIYEAIQSCALFISLISRSTESKVDALFRRERAWAAERQERFAETARSFYLPIVIDDLPIREIKEGGSLVKSINILKAPGGHLPAEEIGHIENIYGERVRPGL